MNLKLRRINVLIYSFLLSIVLFVLTSSLQIQAADSKVDKIRASLEKELAGVLEEVPARGGVTAFQFEDGTGLMVAAGHVGDNEPTQLDSRFHIWSISKTFTAAVILQLIDEGKLALRDTISNWYPDFPNAEKITIGNLLSHTSGISDYFVQPEVSKAWDKSWTEEAMFGVAASRSPIFEPGERYNYSNSNFIMLGGIIEKITGDSLAGQLRNRIFEPLGLKNTFESRDEMVPGGFSPGFKRTNSGFVDVTDKVHPSVVWATGSIISTAEDLRTWCHALVSGKVVSKELTDLLQAPFLLNDGAASPRGLVLSITDTSFGRIIGHGGGPLHGYTATMIYLKERGIIMTTIINGTSPEAPGIIGRAGWTSIITSD